MSGEAMSYHDLYVATEVLPRTRLFDLPFWLMVTCTRTGGWELWMDQTLIAGEYHTAGLRLDANGTVLCDSLNRAEVSP